MQTLLGCNKMFQIGSLVTFRHIQLSINGFFSSNRLTCILQRTSTIDTVAGKFIQNKKGV